MTHDSAIGAMPPSLPVIEAPNPEVRSGWRRWFGRSEAAIPILGSGLDVQGPGVARRLSRKVIPGLPRPGTFKRQQSELRDKLEPTKLDVRTRSVDPRRTSPLRASSQPPKTTNPRLSAPGDLGTMYVTQPTHDATPIEEFKGNKEPPLHSEQPVADFENVSQDDARSLTDKSVEGFDEALLEELEKCWILNLSMHFRDRSNREKFFVTYAQTPSCWRRVTISLDYRDACPGSLESELQSMQFQRDKSARIYESIRDSLPDIQFYDTVTNLKLKTEHDRLHVHVVEDVHEVIKYPPISSISHLACPKFREEELTFDSHLSGFVYKVVIQGQVYIKKEIPGPDTVEEFLYEINALHRLSGSQSVISFGGVVTSNDGLSLKGLLISYAEKGALIDVIYDGKGQLPWASRERWAKQIVQGLSEIHEAGFVQGDFTLSNIVVDHNDDAKIIDINRRGCPVGWEPPEIVALLESKQRISLFIGQKTDIFQLGMVLWAIAMQLDEPELEQRPLTLRETSIDVPQYFRDLVDTCLSDEPRHRSNATSLLEKFPEIDAERPNVSFEGFAEDILEPEYIDPSAAVGRDDIDDRLLNGHGPPAAQPRSTGSHTYVDLTDASGEPYYYYPRGRSPATVRSRDQSFHRATESKVDPRQQPVIEGRHDTLTSPDRQMLTDQVMGPVSRASRTIGEGSTSYTNDSKTDASQEVPVHFESGGTSIERPRTTELVDDITGDLRGIELYSTAQDYPQIVGDDDLTLDS